MKLLHLSDIHYRDRYEKAETGYLSVLTKMTPPLVNLKKCFDQVEKKELDGVVITGDLTEKGTVEDYQKLKIFLDQELGSLPVAVALGNHDIKTAFRNGWGLSDANLNDQKPYNAVYDLSGLKIISLDNAIAGYPNGVITHAQILWLEKQLIENKGKKIILIFHHNLMLGQDNLPSAYWDSHFYELIINSEILGILCGHTHYQYSGHFAGIPYATAPNMSFRGKNCNNQRDVEFEEFPGYQICDFTPDGMKTNPKYLYAEPKFLKIVNMGAMRI